MTASLHGFPDWQTALNTADLESYSDLQTILNGASFSSPIFDMRPYQSYYIQSKSVISNITAAFNNVTTQLIWWNDSVGSVDIYRENYTVHPFYANASVVDVPYDALNIQGPVQGPYLQVILQNGGPAANVCSVRVLGNSRSLPGTFVRETGIVSPIVYSSTDTKLIDFVQSINGGVTVTKPLRISPSQVYVSLLTTGQQGIFTFTAADGQTVDQFVVPPNTTLRQMIQFPRQSIRVGVQNTAGVAATYVVRATAAFDYS